MTAAQIAQYWLATFSLDPAICRDIMLYVRALGDLLADEPSRDDELAVPIEALRQFVVAARERLNALVPLRPADLLGTSILSRPR